MEAAEAQCQARDHRQHGQEHGQLLAAGVFCTPGRRQFRVGHRAAS